MFLVSARGSGSLIRKLIRSFRHLSTGKNLQNLNDRKYPYLNKLIDDTPENRNNFSLCVKM